MHMRRRSGFSLIEILVVVVLIAIMAAIFLPRYLSSSKLPSGKTVASPINQAKGVECSSNLSQIRQSYSMATNMGGDESARPASLAELKLPESMLKCPVGGEPYRFNPANGQVNCAHAGHERF